MSTYSEDKLTDAMRKLIDEIEALPDGSKSTDLGIQTLTTGADYQRLRARILQIIADAAAT